MKIKIIFLLLIIFSSTLYLSGCTSNNDEKKISDKWLFAMDTDQVQIKYEASGIPTLVIIDKTGNVTFWGQGYHKKENIIPYIEKAIDGTSEQSIESRDFTVTTFNNKTFTLSDKIGKVVILDIMGVGCPPCEMQMPELQEIQKQFGDEIIILSVDTYFSGESKQDVIDTYEKYILIDE